MFETLRTVLLLLPTIVELVKQLEKEFPQSGLGPMKFELIKEVLINVNEISNEYLPIIEKMVNVVVEVFNKFGIFKK